MKKKNIIILIVLAIIIVLGALGIYLMNRPTYTGNSLKSDTSYSSSTGLTTDGKLAVYTSNEVQLQSELPGETYTDKRSGFIFSIPDGYEITDMDEYLILYNKDYPDGCIQLFLNSDYFSTDGYYTYEATKMLKERAYYIIDGSQKKISLFDATEPLSQEDFEGVDCKVERTKIYAESGLELQSEYYNLQKVYKGVSIGPSWINGSSNSAKFIEDAKYIWNNLRSLEFTGEGIADYGEELAYETYEFNGYTMEIPTSWEMYEIDKETVVFKPPVLLNETMQGAAILLSITDEPSNKASIDEYDFLSGYTSKPYGDVTMQNPLIDNNRTMESILAEGSKDKLINGHSFRYAKINHKVVRRDLKIYTSMLEKNVSTLHYVMPTNDDRNLNVVFYYLTQGNEYQVDQMADHVMGSFN